MYVECEGFSQITEILDVFQRARKFVAEEFFFSSVENVQLRRRSEYTKLVREQNGRQSRDEGDVRELVASDSKGDRVAYRSRIGRQNLLNDFEIGQFVSRADGKYGQDWRRALREIDVELNYGFMDCRTSLESILAVYIDV